MTSDSGLGLAKVFGIMKQHEGHIDVGTEVGRGVKFTLYWLALAAPLLPAEKPGLLALT